MSKKKIMYSSLVSLDSGLSTDWLSSTLPYIKHAWEKATEKPFVSISPIHIEPDFDPDPEVHPDSVEMIVRIWIEVELK